MTRGNRLERNDSPTTQRIIPAIGALVGAPGVLDDRASFGELSQVLPVLL